MQLAEISQEALTLVRLYRAQGQRLADLRLANGSGHASVLHQAKVADLTARELRDDFDLDADELVEELNSDEYVTELAIRAVNSGIVRDLRFALRSVREVAVYRHAIGSVGTFGELPEGTRQPVSIPLPRQSALLFLLANGAVTVDEAQEHRVTRYTRYHRVVLTELGEALLERFEQ
jgi:regulator of protease activity HflC (stomatin/prohibitin superfamily)